ncbi:hypothetical protein Tco_1399829 [Tanacetum coccineum]
MDFSVCGRLWKRAMEMGSGHGLWSAAVGYVDDCPKALKRVVNKVDKGMSGSSRADDEGFLEVKWKKSGGNIRATKHFKPVSVKPKPQYRPKVHQSAKRVSPKMAHSVGKMNVSTSGNSSKMTSSMTAAT